MEGIRPVKTEWWGAGVVICLERGADLHMAQLMPLPLTVSCIASVKSRLVLPFWYRLTWVVQEKGPLNVCVCVCACVCARARACVFVCLFVSELASDVPVTTGAADGAADVLSAAAINIATESNPAVSSLVPRTSVNTAVTR